MPQEDSENFYRNLQAIQNWGELDQEGLLKPAPEDWVLALSDVQGSTSLIEEGRYKEVNTAGGLAVMAVANVMGHLDFPFVFGGDGVTMMVPGRFGDQVRDVLADTRSIVKSSMGMSLRTGIVPVSLLYEHKLDVLVGKHRISPEYSQAILHGSGADKAEAWLKDPAKSQQVLIPENHKPKVQADFTGFTCRWQDIPSKLDHTVSIIVRPLAEHPSDSLRTMVDVMRHLESLVGSLDEAHPVHEPGLKVYKDAKKFDLEATVVSKDRRGHPRWFRKLLARFQTWFTDLAIRTGFSFGIRIGAWKLHQLKKSHRVSSDTMKFDGNLKMIVSMSGDDVGKLRAYLDSLRSNGTIAYGLHVSNRALMTCLLQNDSRSDVHFIDGGDGGYALAAKELKSQLSQNPAA